MMKKVLVVFGITLLVGLSGTLFAQNDVMFNYQGRVKVQGSAFTGSGQFKFVIINNAGNESLWSNDNTSAGGGEPIASVTIPVSDGIFNAMIGDTGLGMSAINRSIFNHPNDIKLRIWFSDGTYGFQQLLPDHKLANIELLGMVSSSTDFTIYVNGTTGNDEHNGLSAGKPKKTIQAAVDVLPERLKCNVTIDIADGIYREQVYLLDITVQTGKTLTLLGDDSWTILSVGEPAVRITGTDDDVSHIKVRPNAISGVKCHNIVIQGFLFDYATGPGIALLDGYYFVKNCKSANNAGNGFTVIQNCKTNFYDCLATANAGNAGFEMRENCSVNLTDCVSVYNDNMGLWIDCFCYCICVGTGKYSNNGRTGIYAGAFSRVYFYTGYTGEVKNNSEYGFWVKAHAHASKYTQNVISGNTAGNTYTDHEGYLWP